MSGFGWDEAMALGFGVLRLPPDRFWAMTPRELRAAARAFAPEQPNAPSRDWLRDAMQAHPDTRNTPDKGART